MGSGNVNGLTINKKTAICGLQTRTVLYLILKSYRHDNYTHTRMFNRYCSSYTPCAHGLDG